MGNFSFDNGAPDRTNFEHICKHIAYWIYDNAGYTLQRIFSVPDRGGAHYREPDYEY